MLIADFTRNQYRAPRWRKADRLFGIEIELEEVTDSLYIDPPWEATGDGSLRNHGIELRCSPTYHSLLHEQIIRMYKLFETFSWTAGVRTSTHVHIDVRQYDFSDLEGIIATYCPLEPLLFDMCGREREENIYCVPWYRANEIDKLRELIYNLRGSITNELCKYSALFLGPLRSFGTIEFRHAPVWKEPKPLLDWLQIINAIVTEGARRTGEDVLTIADTHSEIELVSKLLGDEAADTLLSYCDTPVDELMEEADSLRFIEDLIGTENNVTWERLPLYVQGEMPIGYHMDAGFAIGNAPVVDYEYEEPYYEDEDREEETW